MDYQTVIEKIYGELQGLWGQGKVADYIPALAKVNPRQFGISLATLDGQYYRAGDAETCFHFACHIGWAILSGRRCRNLFFHTKYLESFFLGDGDPSYWR